MKINKVKQQSQEWYELKAGRIGGTRFGQVISNRKNRLVFDLLNESLNGYVMPDDYVSDEMQFGLDNEPIACEMYAKQSGIDFEKVGLIESEKSAIHVASPDRLNQARGIVLELKCTENGAIHLQRFFDGPETAYLAQIKNYFAVSDDVKEVHWVSYCPYRPERPMVVQVYKRCTLSPDWQQEITKGIAQINRIEMMLADYKQQFIF